MIIEDVRATRIFGHSLSSSYSKKEYCELSLIRISENMGNCSLSATSSLLTDSKNIGGDGSFNARKNAIKTQLTIALEYKDITILASMARAVDKCSIKKLIIHRFLISNIQIQGVRGYISVCEDKYISARWLKSDMKYILTPDNINNSFNMANKLLYKNTNEVSRLFVDGAIGRTEELMILLFDHMKAINSVHQIISEYIRKVFNETREDLIIKASF